MDENFTVSDIAGYSKYPNNLIDILLEGKLQFNTLKKQLS